VNDQPTKRWLTVKDAAEYLNISVRTIYAEVTAGRIRHARIGGGHRSIRFTVEWCDDYVASRTSVTPVPFPAGKRSA
jgi:excisionase family DNA binding protein